MRKLFQKEVREVRLSWGEQVTYLEEEGLSQITTGTSNFSFRQTENYCRFLKTGDLKKGEGGAREGPQLL